jgi:hypothetical protein
MIRAVFFSIFSCRIGTSYLPGGLDAQPPVRHGQPEANAEIFNCSLVRAYYLYNETTNEAPESDDDFVVIGFFATEELAQIELQRLILLDILNDKDRRYAISAIRLNSTHWQGGF